MKQIIGLCLFLILGAAAAQAESLSRERQREILDNYLYVTGQSDRLTDELASGVMDEHGHPVIKCGMSAVADFVMNRHLFDKDLLAGLGAQISNRPVLAGEQVATSPLGLFKVHYTVVGDDAVSAIDNDDNLVPDYVDTVAIIFDSVHTAIVQQLGYPKPPADNLYPAAGDSLYDVYLLDLGAGVYGLSYLDSIFIDGPNSMRATSFMELDRNYDDLPQYVDRPLDAIRVTAAHEYFHAVQFGIDFTESETYGSGAGAISARYWMEMSATWMEEQMYDNLNDYYNYLPYFYNDPRLSLQQFNTYTDLRPYASVVFPIFLAEEYGPNIIKSIWQRCRTAGPGPQFLSVANAAIDSASIGEEDWAVAFRHFTLWNWFTGPRADLAPAGVGFPERDSFPAFPDTMIASWNQYPVVQPAQNRFNPLHNGATFVSFNDLLLIETDTTYWFCNSVLDSTCLDSIEVIDPQSPSEYDFFRVGCGTNDTTYWVCWGGWEDSVCAKPRRVVTGTPGSYPITDCEAVIDGTDTTYRERTFYYVCDSLADSRCVDSIRTDGSGGYDWMYIDSLFDLTFALGTNTNVPVLPQPWGVSFIYRLQDDPDSVIVDSLMIPDAVTVRLAVPNPADYLNVTIALSPATASNSTDYYRSYPYSIPMDVGYFAEADIETDEYANKPSAVLAPYPNPAVVSRMGVEPLRFRMQVATDAQGLPLIETPYLVVDIFTVAGELVRTVDQPEPNPIRGLYEVAWDMRNDGGTEVASGAYIAYGRLYESDEKKQLLAEDHVKVAIIR